MVGFPGSFIVKIEDISRLWKIGGILFLVFLMADEPLPALLTGSGLRQDPHADEPAFVGTPAHKGMAPGKAVGSGKCPILCHIACPFLIADLLDGNRDDVLSGTGGIRRA